MRMNLVANVRYVVASDEKVVQSNSSSVSTAISKLGGSDGGMEMGFWLSVCTRGPVRCSDETTVVGSSLSITAYRAGRPGLSIELIKSFAGGATVVLVILVCPV